MHDQAASLRRLVQETIAADPALRPGARVIVVSGARPGVGASTLAASIARALSRLGKRILIVDADLENPSQARLAGVRPVGSMAELLAGTRRAVELLAPVGDGVQLLAGGATACTPPLGVQGFSRMVAELDSLANDADAVLIDAGFGTTPWSERLWRLAQQILLVSAPQRESMADAYSAVKLARFPELDGRLRLVVNGCDDEGEAAVFAERFSLTCERFLNLATAGAAQIPRCATEGRGGDAVDATFQDSILRLAGEVLGDARSAALRTLQRSMAGRSARGVDARIAEASSAAAERTAALSEKS